MRLSIPPSSSPPTSADVNQVVAYLRAELTTCTDQTQRALLHYELALLFEQARDDHSAAKELLAAVNANASLREPLEHLIALIERRRSHVNLGKLLDRLARIADSPEETIRAHLARGDFLADHRSDFHTAKQAYEHVLELQEHHCLAWLALHYIGARQSDAGLVEKALQARIQGAHEPPYREGLRLQLARFQAMRGRHDLARSTLEAASAPNSPARFPALLQLEQLIASPTDYAQRAYTLEQQASMVSASLGNDSHAAAHGLPSLKLTPEVASDIWMRAALNLEATDPHAPRVLTFLDNAQATLGGDYSLLRATLRQLERRQLDEPLRAVVGKILEQPADSEAFIATVWLRCARAHLSQARIEEALHALAQALEADANCLTARALCFDTLWDQQLYSKLGQAYEATAEHLNDNTGRARNYLLAGITWSFSSETPAASRAALTLAAAAGASHVSVARLSKLLATLRKDGQWITEALNSQVNSNHADRTSATLELSRRAVLRGDLEAAERCFSLLSDIPEARNLGWALLAYGPSSIQPGRTRAAALQGLAAAVSGDSAIALQQIAAAWCLRQGDWTAAQNILESVRNEHEAQAPVAIQLAHLLHQSGDTSAAIQVLTEAAEAVAEPRLQEALHLQAGIHAWRAQARELALRSFESATQNGGPVAGQLLHWALRTAQPDDPAARRKALEASLCAAGVEDRNAYALERFALEVGFSSHHNEAADALNAADELSLDELGEAVQLARALYPQAAHHQEAIKYLQNHSSVGKELVAATDYYKARAQLAVPVDTLLTLAQQWAEQGSLPAALEWFSLAVAACDRQAEAAARLSIAPHLPQQGEAALRASVALLLHLCGESPACEDTENAVSQLVNTELVGPSASPRDRARALEAAEPHYAADNPTDNSTDNSTDNRLTVLLLAAYNWFACGQYEEALTLFRRVVDADPDDLAGWYGVADCAKALSRPLEEANAHERVGSLHLDSKQAASALREAARLNLDELQDEESGYRCLGQAVSLDIEDYKAFDLWFRYVRDLGEREQLIELCTARLEVAESPKELTRLHWERARAYRHLDRLEQALADLDNVRLIDPRHVGARALASEIFISLRNYSRAAAELAQLAAMPHAPAEQRHMSAMAAVDLYEAQLGDIDSALKVLDSMAGAPGDHLPLKERLAKTLARAARWSDAVRLLGELSKERKTASERAEAARLRLAILRDELGVPEQGFDTVTALLRNSPADGEALDLVLEGVFEEDASSALLREHLPALLQVTVRELEPEAAARVARVAEELDDLDLRLLALSTLVCLGSPSDEVLVELEMLQQRCAPYPRMAITPSAAAVLVDVGDDGPLLEVMRLLAPHLPDIIGPTLKSLGVGRRERKRALELPDVRAGVMAWAGAFALHELEVFVGGQDTTRLTVFADSKHGSIVLGQDVAPPFTPVQRAALAAKVLGLKHGTSIALARDPIEVAALLVAACRVGGASLESPPFALTSEFERLLSRELPRRVRRALEPLAAQAAAQEQDPLEYATAARASLDRIAAVAAGDFSWVLLGPQERVHPLRNMDGAALERQRRLLEFCLSPAYLEIRQQLGMGAQ